MESLESFGITTDFGFATVVVVVLGIKGGKVRGVVLNKLGGKGGDCGNGVSLIEFNFDLFKGNDVESGISVSSSSNSLVKSLLVVVVVVVTMDVVVAGFVKVGFVSKTGANLLSAKLYLLFSTDFDFLSSLLLSVFKTASNGFSPTIAKGGDFLLSSFNVLRLIGGVSFTFILRLSSTECDEISACIFLRFESFDSRESLECFFLRFL